MRKTKKKSSIWQYLASLGLTDSQDEEAIKQAKKAYWQAYDKQLKKRKRGIEKREVTVSFPKTDIAHLRTAAKKQGYTLAGYIKAATLAQLKQTHLIPFFPSFKVVLQQIAACKQALQHLAKQSNSSMFRYIKNYEEASTQINQLDQFIRQQIYYPKSIEQQIIALMNNSPHLKQHLISLIQTTYDSEEHEQKD